MYSQKKIIYVLLAISIVFILSMTALPEEDTSTILPEGTKIFLEKEGKAFFVLDTPIKFEKLEEEGKWMKTQITGWVLKSDMSEVTEEKESDKQEKNDSNKEDRSEPDGKETDQVTTGKAGPFHIIVNNLFFRDTVEDRFGTKYDSGSRGSFLLVNLVVKNTSTAGDKNLYKTDIKLIDERGRQYKSVGISDEQSFVGGSIKPNEERQGHLVFSVFDDPPPVKLQISGRPCNRCNKYEKVFELPELEMESKNSQS